VTAAGSPPPRIKAAASAVPAARSAHGASVEGVRSVIMSLHQVRAGDMDARLAKTGLALLLVAGCLIAVWAVSLAHPSSAGSVAVWGGAVAVAVAAVAATILKGRHAGWFHPLSLPLVAVAVMSLGAPLWVYATHEPAGLLFDPGHAPANAPPLAAALSVTACEALALTVAGYLAGAAAALAVTREPAPVKGGPVLLRCGALRRAGFTLMACGALTVAALTIAGRGSAYGADQTSYGTGAAAAAAAPESLFAGLILVTIAAAHSGKPARARDLLRGREWTVLAVYAMATAVGGGRAGLIAPAVYLAWAVSTQVRVIPARWVLTALAAALAAAAAIAGWRASDGLSLGSPAAVAQGAADDVFSPAWLTQQTVALVPSQQPYLHGSTYAAALEGQLPGPLARVTGADSRTASARFRDLIDFTNPDQGFAESYTSEAYLNFGLPGCATAGVLLGAVAGWAWRRCRSVPASARDVLYPVLLAGLVYGLRSDALTQVKDVLYPMLAVWLVTGWCQDRHATPAARPGHPSLAANRAATML
jgi:hypothetical protein